MKKTEIHFDCLAFQLSRARNKVFNWYGRALEPIGLTPTYVYVLGLLMEREHASPGEIAESLDLQKPTITGLLNRMIRDNLVIRKNDKSSRRSLVITLSPKGRKVGEKAYVVLRNADTALDKIFDGNLENLKEEVKSINRQLTVAEEK